jgi:hypothetical protein
MRRSLNLRIASPCSVAWDEMHGTHRVRSCNLCDKQVFNISELTRQEVEALVLAHAGKLCVTYYQRSDGTIMLADCTYHEQRGGWLPAIAAASLFGIGVIATPPAVDDELANLEIYSGGLGGIGEQVSWVEDLPVVMVDEAGEITYRGQLIATTSTRHFYDSPYLDSLFDRLEAEATKTRQFEPPSPPLDRALVVQAHGSTDARVVNTIRWTAERAGYYVLYAEKK